MNSDFHTSADYQPTAAAIETANRAQRVIDDLMARIGVDGLTAALANPGLLASIDQHAAAVREAVRRSGRRISVHTLAQYATSVIAAVRRAGRSLPQPGEAELPRVEWEQADWYLLRLVGVCAIAEERGWL